MSIDILKIFYAKNLAKKAVTTQILWLLREGLHERDVPIHIKTSLKRNVTMW